MYDEETLKSMLKTIAERNNCTPEEVDDNMFDEYVCNQTSLSEERFEYEAATGKITYSKSYELL